MSLIATNGALDLDLHKKQGLALFTEATELGYGGAAGGGKSHLARVAMIFFCYVIPGLNCYLFRRQSNELVKNHLMGPTGFPAMLSAWSRGGFVRIVKNEIRFANGPDPKNKFEGGSRIFLCHCFTGDTLIQTTAGNRPIRDLVGKSGLIKVTKSFTASFENVRLTRQAASTVTVTFEDGSYYRCTPDHRFLTLGGFVEAKDLTGKACLTNQSQLSVQKLKSLKERSSIETVEDITEVLLPDCIGLFGNIITGQFQKVFMYITLMKTRLTTKLKILSLERKSSIEGCTRLLKDLKNKQNKLEPRDNLPLGNGTQLQRDINGTKSKLLGFNPIKLIRLVRSAAKRLRGLPIQDIKHAQRAADSSYNEQKESFKTCLSVKPDGIEDVYCMTVPDIGLFPLSNGVLVSNCQHEKDVFNWLGPEMHFLVIEQAEQFTPFMIKMLRGRNRIPEALNIPEQYRKLFPRVMYTFNPGGVGHAYFKQHFVRALKRGPDGISEIVEQPDEEGGKFRQFIQAKLDDNPSVNPVEYRKTLRGLPPRMAKALEEGDFDQVVGAFFPEIDRDKHLITPFKLSPYDTRFMSMDWGACGEGDPFSIGWWCVIGENGLYPKGSLICYRRWHGAGLPKVTASQIAEGILKREVSDPQIVYRVAGGDIQQKRGTGPSIFEIFSAHGVVFNKADQRREEGAAQVRERLVGKNDKPMIYFFEEMEDELETMMNLQHDLHNPNECTQFNDHFYEMVRYGCMSRPFETESPISNKTIDQSFQRKHSIDELWKIRESGLGRATR